MSKKILVVGGGGREHAIIKALKKSPDCGEVWCAPGNGGIGYDAHCVNIKATDVETMVGFAETEKFDYVVVAQDDPLALGMVDALAAVGIPAFGPDKAAARIEASKVFSKDLMKKYGIPTAKYETFDDPAKVMEYIKAEGKYPVVIKADGLALGKGVLICENEEQAAEGVKEIMLDKKFGASGNHVVKNLSGGNQQKVLVGRWLLTDPDILIVDEPTRGIDVGAKAEIHSLITKLAGEGKAIIMISSELPEVMGMSDRIVVMHEGTMTAIVDRKDFSSELILKYATSEVPYQPAADEQ